MTTIVVLFNLKPGTDVAAYEQWARARDLPTVNGLDSVDRFEVLRSAGLLMSDAAPPYAYVELIRVNDMEKFGADVSSETVQKVAAEFGEFADNPLFILTEAL
ncbi:MAG: hypothetical protein JJU31_15745 [Wenzhouxiangella sp.]|nr:hypothetical protein [Wenzhouxiangella sp.]MCH8479064.1 hypothetical protein [Wenzhouxiangella sp.]TVQ37892.1 MAG: REDY-like protein HapK [Wenzhouxiangella sp.]